VHADDDASEVNNYFITQPDLSQEHAIIHARNERGLVIHGPPGTGKSQTITNIIADTVARKKRVLLVCDKRAALDVVYNRLQKIQNFALLVHDPKRATLYGEMLHKINKRDTLTTNHVQTEAISCLEVAKEFDELLAKTKQDFQTLHTQTKAGLSLYELYLHANQANPYIDIPDAQNYDQKSVIELCNTLVKYEELAKHLANPLNPLYHRYSFAKTDIVALKTNLEFVKKIVAQIQDVMHSSTQYAKDVALINPKRRLLMTLDAKLRFFNANKDALLRFINPKWYYVVLKTKKLIREQQLDDLTVRWENLSPLCRELHTSLKKLKLQKSYKKLLWEKITTQNALDFINQTLIDLDQSQLILQYDSLKLTKSQRDIKHKLLAQENWKETLLNSFYVAWIKVYDTSFSSQNYETAQTQLQTLLTKKIHLVQSMILTNLTATHIPEKQEVIRELEKKRNMLQVRELIEKYEQALLSLFPVWLCSPQTVSDLFPLKPNLFDVVIYDESSQLRVENSLPSILRAKKIIVCGDDKQLPPTSFFESIDDEFLYDDELTDDAKSPDQKTKERMLLEDESLLMRAKTVFPSVKLKTHYRSKFEELIAFSNVKFYSGDLQIVPTNEVSAKVMSYQNVKGTWKENANEKEAKAVVELIASKLEDSAKQKIQNSISKHSKSIGVITFNVKQRDLILVKLDEKARNDESFAQLLDAEFAKYADGEYIGLFVKNIENVQGDERDCIIFSIGYAPDETKKLRYNFGPLNGVYGPNRLNVAISRAKEQIYVISSFEPSEFHYKGGFDGPRLLGEYLTYVKAVSDNDEQIKQRILRHHLEHALPSLPLALKIQEELNNQHIPYANRAGSDAYHFPIGFRKNTKFELVVSTEDEFAKISSAKERDVYRPFILKRYGWNVTQMFAKDWYMQPKYEIQKLKTSLHK
jgi:hypothetical protein